MITNRNTETDYEFYGMTRSDVWDKFVDAKNKAKTNPDYERVASAIYMFWDTGRCHCICCLKPEDRCVFSSQY